MKITKKEYDGIKKQVDDQRKELVRTKQIINTIMEVIDNHERYGI